MPCSGEPGSGIVKIAGPDQSWGNGVSGLVGRSSGEKFPGAGLQDILGCGQFPEVPSEALVA